MYEISVEKTKSKQLHDLVDSVQNGEEVIFTKNSKPVAKLTGMSKQKPDPKFGSAEGLFVLTKDFNEPLVDFDEYRK